jgi:hypothetical protein
MRNSLLYRLSLGLTIVLTLAAFFTLLGWLGTLVIGIGQLPFLSLLPWKTIGFVALAALNCTIRARLIVQASPVLS